MIFLLSSFFNEGIAKSIWSIRVFINPILAGDNIFIIMRFLKRLWVAGTTDLQILVLNTINTCLPHNDDCTAGMKQVERYQLGWISVALSYTLNYITCTKYGTLF